MSFLVMMISLCFSSPFAHAKTHQLSQAEAKQVETSYNRLSGKTENWELLSGQAFRVELNSGKLKDVIFAPFKNTRIQFVLLNQDAGSVVQVLPKSELAIVEIFAFSKVDAVSFKDINGDGTKDILVLTTYFDSRPVQGEGIGGGKTKVGYAYMSNKDEFKLDESCGEDVSTVAALEKCLRAKAKR